MVAMQVIIFIIACFCCGVAVYCLKEARRLIKELEEADTVVKEAERDAGRIAKFWDYSFKP